MDDKGFNLSGLAAQNKILLRTVSYHLLKLVRKTFAVDQISPKMTKYSPSNFHALHTVWLEFITNSSW